MKKNIVICLLATTWSISISFAQLNAEEAQKLQKVAKYNQKKADKLEIIALDAHKEAERFRYLMVADEMAIKSTEISDKELAALLALQAYNYNIKYKGYTRNSNIYHGLSNALKNYGKLPTRLDSNTQTLDDYDKKKMTIDDLKRGELLRKILRRQTSQIEQIEFSHSGKLMATVSNGKSIRVWNLENMRERPMTIIENDSIRNLLFTGDDSQIVCRLFNSRKEDSIIHVWPLKMDLLANQLCSFLSHNMTKEDWEQYVGDLPYESTCKK